MGKSKYNNIWFTSDEHYGHENIIKFCSRPFADAKEMTERLIDRHNECVKDGDTVYHLGDFSFADAKTTDSVLRRLNGTPHLIIGNHDTKLEDWYTLRSSFESISLIKNIHVGDQYIVMCHFPMLTWHWSGGGSWMLHGHEHGTRPNDFAVRRADMGVDANDFRPIHYEELAIKFAQVPKLKFEDRGTFNNGFGEYTP
jgi:calcineurin-like phosphoesterase family protein